MTFYVLEKSVNLHAQYRKTFRFAGYHLLLLQHEGRPVLLDNICPHAGYPMKDGLIIDGSIRCPMHGYLFDLDKGDCLLSPEGPCNGIRIFEVTRIGEDLGVFL